MKFWLLAVLCTSITCKLPGKPVRLLGIVQSDQQRVCQKLNIDKLFRLKKVTEKKLANSIIQVQSNKIIKDTDRQYRLRTIQLFGKELNVSAVAVYSAVENFKSVLRGDYRSLQQLKEISKRRLEQLKTATLDAEAEINLILDTEHDQNVQLKKENNNKVKGFFKELIGGVAVAADILEDEMDDNAFERQIDSRKLQIETVVRVSGNDEANDDEGIVMLVDSDSNHYVLSKAKDATTTHVDHALLKDTLVLFVTAFALAVMCSMFKLPFIFACILAGVILGPSGSASITSIVQIETIGELGVFFILFSVGMEFSPDKLRKVMRQSLAGTLGINACLILIGLLWGQVFGILPRQSIFVTLCLSFTSTPMLSNLVEGHTDSHTGSGVGEDFISLLVSMLVLQDVILGVFMATLPILAGHNEEKTHSFASLSAGVHHWFHGAFGGPGEYLFFTIAELLFALSGILFFAYVLNKYVAGKFFRGLNLIGSKESFLLGIISAMSLLLMTTEYFGISMELGCYLCGAITSSLGEKTHKQVMNVVDPLKTLFSTLFFASIGFHIFPSFLMAEIVVFIPITLLVVATKFLVCLGVLHHLLPSGSKSKWMVACGLAQLSEFSFVLGSRARRFGLIGREVYLIILSVTTLSLLISPFFWRLGYIAITRGWLWKSTLKSVVAPLHDK